MFQSLFSWIKGVWHKMIGKSSIKQKTGYTLEIGDKEHVLTNNLNLFFFDSAVDGAKFDILQFQGFPAHLVRSD